MNAPHADRDHSGDPFALPFWPPAHRHAIETGQRQPAPQTEVERLRRWKAEATEVILGLQDLGNALGLGLGERITGTSAAEAAQRLTARAESAESVARGQQQVIEAQRATLDAVRALVVDWLNWPAGTTVDIHGLAYTVLRRLDAAPNETKDQP